MKVIGVIGSVFAALCCFTPLLPILLGAIGLSAWVPVLYRDVILLPFLSIFVVIALVGYWRSRDKEA